MRRALVLYASLTGNTDIVAQALAAGLGDFGWLVDSRKIARNWKKNSTVNQIDFAAYDLLLTGSPVHWSLPLPWLVELLRAPVVPSQKIIPGPQCGVAFATYGGAHLGPREADPCLTYLEVLFEHLGFQCAGRLAIPGKHGEEQNPFYFHNDLHKRPDQNDLQNISAFIEELHRREEIVSLLGNES